MCNSTVFSRVGLCSCSHPGIELLWEKGSLLVRGCICIWQQWLIQRRPAYDTSKLRMSHLLESLITWRKATQMGASKIWSTSAGNSCWSQQHLLSLFGLFLKSPWVSFAAGSTPVKQGGLILAVKMTACRENQTMWYEWQENQTVSVDILLRKSIFQFLGPFPKLNVLLSRLAREKGTSAALFSSRKPEMCRLRMRVGGSLGERSSNKINHLLGALQ